ncbi:conserved protein of unknown function [Xenorhabdus poinarii G6]|uniref:Uncharacterized protein n=1 Tax=Xenorhabdus poinarii G6 TaxID=1354304 RepID=A0A068R5Z2_9GAMM|nr:conserved protein of unknown function [Xenorhabdus poinarii G6]
MAFIGRRHQVECSTNESPYEGGGFMRIIINIIMMTLFPVITQCS